MEPPLLEPGPDTLHGSFSADREPVLWVDPGEVVRVRTLDVGWGLEPPSSPDAPRRKHEPREDGPALCGPIGVRGAAPGMTLEVRIEAVRPGSWGWTYAGADMSPLNAALGLTEVPLRLVRWRLDAASGRATSDAGLDVAMRPFPGTLGVAPAAGAQPGWHPFAGGGNLDCRELVAGSSLFLPVLAPGARVSVGDGHARQGDGEVAGMAIECPLDELRLRFRLHDDLPLPLLRAHRPGGPALRPVARPVAHTPAGVITFGFGERLEDALVMALEGMLDLLVEGRGLARADALVLAGVAVEMRITQVVNGVQGVHALLPLEAAGEGVRTDERRRT